MIAGILLAWLKLLALDGDLAKAEPKTLRYRVLHTAARLTRGGCRSATIAVVAQEPQDERHRDWLLCTTWPNDRVHDAGHGRPGRGSGHSAVTDQQAEQILPCPTVTGTVCLIGLRYRADRLVWPISRPNRRPFDEEVHWNHW